MERGSWCLSVLRIGIDVLLCIENVEMQVHGHGGDSTKSGVGIIPSVNLCLSDFQVLLYIEPWAMNFDMSQQELNILSDQAELVEVESSGARLCEAIHQDAVDEMDPGTCAVRLITSHLHCHLHSLLEGLDHLSG